MKKQVKVKPNSKIPAIVDLDDGSLVVYVKSSPVGGKANQEVISLLAKKYQVSQSSITIKSGSFSKIKVIDIQLE